MDGNCLKRNSIDSYDRISELPDEIILAILCCLPLKEAASTSVLSSRWLDLWKHSPKLEFTTKIDAELVSSILDSHKALSLDAFNISFHIDKSSHSQVTKWLDFVFSRRVRTLRLDFQCNRSMNMVVLEEVVRESRISPLFFKSLQRLRLEGLKMSGEGIGTFLHNCPSLKCLTIIYANFTSNVEICGTGRLVLRYLNLYYSMGRKSIKIYAPNLICALVDQESGKVMFENVPKLKRLTFRIRNQKYLMQHFARATSCSISTLQSLALTLYHPKEFLASGTFPEMPNLKELLVKDYGVYDHGSLLPLTDLLWACPHLREFKLKFAGDLKNATSVPMNVERRVHRHLKMFEFQGSSGGVSDRIVELAAYISEKCVALEHVVIGRPLSGIVEDEGDREYLKLQLQGKLPQHIQVQLFVNVY